MTENNAPSYEELKDSEQLSLVAIPYTVSIGEGVDAEMSDEPISTSLSFETKVSAQHGVFPFNYLQIIFREEDQKFLESLSAKYPIGWIKFSEDEAFATLRCRHELINRIIPVLDFIKNDKSKITFTISIPQLPSKRPSIYPIMSYYYDAQISTIKREYLPTKESKQFDQLNEKIKNLSQKLDVIYDVKRDLIETKNYLSRLPNALILSWIIIGSIGIFVGYIISNLF